MANDIPAVVKLSRTLIWILNNELAYVSCSASAKYYTLTNPWILEVAAVSKTTTLGGLKMQWIPNTNTKVLAQNHKKNMKAMTRM